MSNIISIDSKELININSNQDIIDKWLKFANVSNNTKQAYKKRNSITRIPLYFNGGPSRI